MRGVLVLGLSIPVLTGCNSKPSGPFIAASRVDLSTVRQQAQARANAALQRDHDTFADYTHPRLVELVGGRAKFIENERRVAKEGDAAGLKLVAYEVSEPGELVIEGGSAYVILPTTLRVRAPKFRGVTEAYMLGISTDGGKTWKFVDASLSTPEQRYRLFPDLPARIQFPKKKEPVFEDLDD
jgi:hypothetical protein